MTLGHSRRGTERAIAAVPKRGLRAANILQAGMTRVSTSGMGDAILKELDRSAE